ncbi:hypothetical protein DUNSADRAFT_318 [Dunaliella salina]|uniref:Uncharacterized protein n=1 Tax=Dunaliella salina TaxID=3046 RepID=A0ABQ7FZ70_DUNSA|nr:hypothetical protein DUNSADRAFT_318 [Dunaliella salina]|eukprot:KAF5827646.1 hypothetical protein DUNSADRAFT_318 [Dunaliella salina]
MCCAQRCLPADVLHYTAPQYAVRLGDVSTLFSTPLCCTPAVVPPLCWPMSICMCCALCCLPAGVLPLYSTPICCVPADVSTLFSTPLCCTSAVVPPLCWPMSLCMCCMPPTYTTPAFYRPAGVPPLYSTPLCVFQHPCVLYARSRVTLMLACAYMLSHLCVD